LAVDERQWFALWTQSHCEQLVCDQLRSKRFETFLPTLREWSRRAGVRRLIPVPMFPGYLFVHHAIEKRSYIDIMSTRGVVRILGERWDRLAAIDDAEIDAIQRLNRSDLALQPYPYLREGHRVRIIQGPLTGVEGLLVRTKANRELLVLSVNLLNRSVAVELDCADVVPIESSAATRLVAADVMLASPCR
jgi:transcription termination/antitermination protein NusG